MPDGQLRFIEHPDDHNGTLHRGNPVSNYMCFFVYGEKRRILENDGSFTGVSRFLYFVPDPKQAPMNANLFGVYGLN